MSMNDDTRASAIIDDELLLHHYRDGLSKARLQQIDAALCVDAALGARRQRLLAVLDAARSDTPAEPDSGFESRLHAALDSRIGAPAAVATFVARRQLSHQRRARWRLVAAAAIVLGVGFFAGRVGTPPVPDPAAPLAAADQEFAGRVLAAYTSAHLRATEGLLLQASGTDGASDAELADALIDSNRLYAEAARAAGNVRLATFLQQLEPLLRELANPSPTADIETEGEGAAAERADLIFQLRATRARLEPQPIRT